MASETSHHCFVHSAQEKIVFNRQKLPHNGANYFVLPQADEHRRMDNGKCENGILNDSTSFDLIRSVSVAVSPPRCDAEK